MTGAETDADDSGVGKCADGIGNGAGLLSGRGVDAGVTADAGLPVPLVPADGADGVASVGGSS